MRNSKLIVMRNSKLKHWIDLIASEDVINIPHAQENKVPTQVAEVKGKVQHI